jgi:hypothetical protein
VDGLTGTECYERKCESKVGYQGHHLLKSTHEIGCMMGSVATEPGRNIAAPRLGNDPGKLQAMGKNELILLRVQAQGVDS